MENKKKQEEKKVVLSVEDFNIISNYLKNKPLPYIETDVIMGALKRAQLMNVVSVEEESKTIKKEKEKIA